MEETQIFRSFNDTFTCPRRLLEVGPWERTEGLDHWEQIGDDQVCSFCGSMDPYEFEDFLDLVIENPDIKIRVGFSDKNYKIYITRPEVTNSHEGAVKFYRQHLLLISDGARKRILEKYTLAQRVSNHKFVRWLESVIEDM